MQVSRLSVPQCQAAQQHAVVSLQACLYSVSAAPRMGLAPAISTTLRSRSIVASTAVCLERETTALEVQPAGVPDAVVKQTQPQQRRRTAKSSLPVQRSLRQVPGVGPKNEALFNAKGLTTVDQLVSVHKDMHNADEDRTKAYIQEVVGIKNKGYLSMIVGYLRHLDEKEQAQSKEDKQQAGSFGLQPKLTLSVEGNISSGKSTFLQILKETGIDQHMQVVPEPVEKWQNVGDGKVNLLMEFYQNPQRFAYTFQNFVFLTRMVQERESYSQSMCRLLERSIFSDRMVFVRAVHKSKFMNDTELAIYDSWFDPMIKTLPTLVPNGFIYLRADPNTCHRRMQKRSRNEESTVQLDYLQDLHQHHEDWLWSGGVKATDSKYLYIPRTNQTLLNKNPSGVDLYSSPPPANATSMAVLPANGLQYEIPEVPRALKDSLFILDDKKASHMLPQLNQIPALILDCNDDVDVDNDVEYRQHVSEQVKQYTEYVRKFTQAKATASFETLNEPAFNGYFLRDSNGNVLYTAPEWHKMSHSDQQQQMARYEAVKAKVSELQATMRN